MKKVLFMISVAAVTLASCSNESTEYVGDSNSSPKEIAFFPVNQKATRAAVQGTTFPTTNTMEVVAYQTNPSATNYFTQKTFKKDGSGSYWRGWDATLNNNTGDYSPVYWPLSAAKLNFFAVSGADVNNADITISSTLLKTDVADVNYSKSATTGTYTNATQSDIMYAFGRGEVTQSSNDLTFNGGNAVAMQFKHAMSLIKFQVKAADAASTAITINSIKLNGASYTGALKLTSDDAITANTGTPAITVTWTPDASEDDVTVPNISSYTLTQTYAPADGGAEGTWASLIVVPNATKGFDSFTVNYTFGGHTYDYTYTPSPVVPVAAGNVYTYQLNFQLHEITISPSVTAWATGASSEVNIP